MTRLRVTTESGSVYVLDTDAKTLQRTPGEDAGSVAFDGENLKYEYLAYGPQVRYPMLAFWDDNGNPKLRQTTPVVTIEEIPSE